MKSGFSALDAPTQILIGDRTHGRPDARRPRDTAVHAPAAALRREPRPAVAAATTLSSHAGAAAGQRSGADPADRPVPLRKIALWLAAVALAGTIVLAVGVAVASDGLPGAADGYKSTRSMPPAVALAT